MCRAGAYVSGAAGSNECPAGAARIVTEAACRTAAAAAGKTVGSPFVETNLGYKPRGCFYFTTNNYAFFNTHAVGGGNPKYQLLCAAATTGAPPRRCGRGEPKSCADVAGVSPILVQMWPG